MQITLVFKSNIVACKGIDNMVTLMTNGFSSVFVRLVDCFLCGGIFY